MLASLYFNFVLAYQRSALDTRAILIINNPVLLQRRSCLKSQAVKSALKSLRKLGS